MTITQQALDKIGDLIEKEEARIKEQLIMTNIIELDKGEFFTIEAFEFELEDGCIYEQERDEELDTYWYDNPIFKGQQLDEYVKTLCIDCLGDSLRIVDISARRYATIVDGFPDDYGDSWGSPERYVWTGKELVTECQYIENQS
jgi:hypothetical protein